MTKDPVASLGFDRRRRSSAWFAPLTSLVGILATAAALTVGAILAIFTAAAVAVIALVASLVVFFAGFALRARRQVARPSRHPGSRSDDVIDAHKVGETWVAYGWERQGR